MESLLNSLTSPETMGSYQWLIIALILFISIGSIYLVFRLYKIFSSIGKTTYKPNIGLSRVDYRQKK